MCFDRGVVQINDEEERDCDRLRRAIGLTKGGCPVLPSEVSVGECRAAPWEKQPQGLEWPPRHLARASGPDGAFALHADGGRHCGVAAPRQALAQRAVAPTFTTGG